MSAVINAAKNASAQVKGCDPQVSWRMAVAVHGPVSASASWRRTSLNSAPRRQCRDHCDDGGNQADQGRILRLRELPPGESDTQGQRG